MIYQGLTTDQAQENLKKYGSNDISDKTNPLAKFFRQLISPINVMLVLAIIVSYRINKIEDSVVIAVLFFVNLGISFIQELKADNAIEKLKQHLNIKVSVLRDAKWDQLLAIELVVNDIVRLNIGDIVPADVTVLDSTNLTLNESALTGESLPIEKKSADILYSGSYISTGTAIVKVTSVGRQTYFGKILHRIEGRGKQSILEKDILRISKYLTLLSLVCVAILTVVFIAESAPFYETLTLVLGLLIAGIPVSMPTVLTLIIEIGVLSLAKKSVIVRRISSLEDLSNVNLLLTDKTGTLTKNKLTVQDVAYFTNDSHKALTYAQILASQEKSNPIEQAIFDFTASKIGLVVSDYKLEKYYPADSLSKKSVAELTIQNKEISISLGAPQVVATSMLQHKKALDHKVEEFALAGKRSLVLSIYDKITKEDLLLALFAVSDELREDSAEVIGSLKENGIRSVMLTGDHIAIAREVSSALGLGGGVKENVTGFANLDRQSFLNTAAFAGIKPDDKLQITEIAKKYFTVAVTGDGVNDLPAIKTADVGIAVSNSVDALKSAADIVLLSDGLSVIKDAITESRKIFQRVYAYSVYRISESFRLIITTLVLGIIYKIYPLTPVQIILIALLNDIPIISLAFDNVKIVHEASKIDVNARFIRSSVFGFIGVVNSLALFFIMNSLLHVSWPVIQTVFFLKLTVSGHLLLYVARTKEKWYSFLPSKEVIAATTITQFIASLFALTGIFMPAKISFGWVLFVWIWAFIWMQVSEYTKKYNK